MVFLKVTRKMFPRRRVDVDNNNNNNNNSSNKSTAVGGEMTKKSQVKKNGMKITRRRWNASASGVAAKDDYQDEGDEITSPSSISTNTTLSTSSPSLHLPTLVTSCPLQAAAAQDASASRVVSVQSMSLASGQFDWKSSMLLQWTVAPLTAAATTTRPSQSCPPRSSPPLWSRSSSLSSMNDDTVSAPIVLVSTPFPTTCATHNVLDRQSAFFIRVSDLPLLLQQFQQQQTPSSDMATPNWDYPSANPPPTPHHHHSDVTLHNPKELWVAIHQQQEAMPTGTTSPLLHATVEALVDMALKTVYDTHLWQADSKTQKLVKTTDTWYSQTFHRTTSENGTSSTTMPCVTLPHNHSHDPEVLVWSGYLSHGLHGSDIPLVRSAGIVPLAPALLAAFLADSSRVQEYNKMSLGRTDLAVLEEQQGDGPAVTKIFRSESKPPVIRKTMQLTSLFHVRPLEHAKGFLIVCRAVTPPAACASTSSSDGSLMSEILLSVNVLLAVEGNENCTLMINVNHIHAPMIPMMIAKRIGLQAAVNFFHDIRKCC